MKHLSVRAQKICTLTAGTLLLVVAVALIPLDLFVCNIPTFLPATLAILGLAGIVFYVLRFSAKMIFKILPPLLCAVLVVAVAAVPYCLPYWNSYSLKGYSGNTMNYDEELSLAEALEDLGAVRRYVKKVHPMYRNGLTAEFQQHYAKAETNLRAMERITVNDLRREIQILLHPMFDAHTTTYNSYPDDRYLRTAPHRMSEGYSIRSVNGLTVRELKEIAAPYFCYETEAWITVDCGSLASLEFYGLDQFPVTYVWEKDGETVTDVCAKEDFVPYSEYLELRKAYSTGGEKTGFVSYRLEPEKSLAILTLTQCIYNDEYVSCVREMFAEVKRQGIRNVAVDLRGNGGGNSMVANEFVRYLPVDTYRDSACDWRWGFLSIHYDGVCSNDRYEDLTFDGQVYILTDHNSFSSSMLFAMIIQDNGLGRLIGESPANAVNGYGDVAAFRLPNSGLFLQVSTKKWYRADPSNPDAFLVPDIPCAGGDALEELGKAIAQNEIQ